MAFALFQLFVFEFDWISWVFWGSVVNKDTTYVPFQFGEFMKFFLGGSERALDIKDCTLSFFSLGIEGM